MLKKTLATVIIATLSQAQANQINLEKNEIESLMAQSFDQLNYRLNVEWNQKDGSFLNETIKNFEAQILTLQSKGLSNEDLIDFTMSRIKDKSIQEEVQKIADIIKQNNMSAGEARSFAINRLNATYSHGTSWSGGRVAIKAGLIIAVAVAIGAVVASSCKEEVPTPTPTPPPMPPAPSPVPPPS